MSRALLWASGLAPAVLFIGLAVYLLPLQPNIIALQFAGSATAFAAILNQWGPEGVALFRSHLPLDGVLLILYGAFGYLLTARTQVFTACSPVRRLQLSLLMPVAALADAGENLLHWHLTSGPVDGATWLVPLATTCSAIKFAGIVLFGLAALLARRVERR